MSTTITRSLDTSSVNSPMPKKDYHLSLHEFVAADGTRLCDVRWTINHYNSLEFDHVYYSDHICTGNGLYSILMHRIRAYNGKRFLHAYIRPDNVDATFLILGENGNEILSISECTRFTPPTRVSLFAESSKLTSEGKKLTLVCRLTIGDDDPDVLLAVKTIEKYRNSVSCMGSLLSSGAWSDVVVCVDDREFQVHRAILCAHSSVFAAMFERYTIEREESRVDIEDCDGDTFQEFLRYIYTGNTTPLTSELALDLMAVADKYGVQLLKDEAVEYLQNNLSAKNALRVLVAADLYNEQKLKADAHSVAVDNLQTLKASREWEPFSTHQHLTSCILESEFYVGIGLTRKVE